MKKGKNTKSTKTTKLSPKKEIEIRLRRFQDIFQAEGTETFMPWEWKKFICSLLRHYHRQVPAAASCVLSFEAGIKWQIYHNKMQERHKSMQLSTRKDAKLNPQLLETIVNIVEKNEMRNGQLSTPKKLAKKQNVNDPCFYTVDKDIINDFKHSLEKDSVTPPTIWQRCFGEFFSELLNELPVYDACTHAFTAGRIWQKYRKKLQD